MYDDLRYDAADGVATITIDRPDRLNALRPHSLHEMADAVNRADRDPAIGVVVVTGEGTKAFCAGGDLGEVAADDAGRERSDLGRAEILEWVNAFRQCGKPVIAKVRGYCIGLGNELNLLCDLTVAGESARFGQAGPRVGSVPMVGGTQMLPLVCGLKRAKEVLFLCRTYSGDEAVRIGLANVVVPDDRLDAEVQTWTSELLAKSPQSLRIGKLSMSYLFDLQWPALQHGLELTGWLVTSPEMQEGASAFLEKRAPRFRNTES
jgi:naphthoate synthase/2-ketocyclohexanecarboxyl-CoA hydrolase